MEMNLKDVKAVKSALEKCADIDKAGVTPKAFKAVQNKRRDQFLGVNVPDQRKVAKEFYARISDDDLQKLLHDPIHEVRLTAVFMLVSNFEKAKTQEEKEKWLNMYLDNLAGIDNWDLVDSSAHQILGKWLEDKPRHILADFAKSNDVWKQRIAMVATYHFIRKNDFEDTFKIARILLNHDHDLIQKAVGWMLKEAGKRDEKAEEEFLRKHYKAMPRTALRCAIEKFPEPKRKAFLAGEV